MSTYLPRWDSDAGPSAVLVPVRVATTCSADTAAAISTAVTELVVAFHQRNECRPDQVKLVLFTATPDLRAAKPATAARHAGWHDAQLLSLAEMPTDDDLPHCIRAVVFVERDRHAPALRMVYINGAEALRPDLVDS